MSTARSFSRVPTDVREVATTAVEPVTSTDELTTVAKSLTKRWYGITAVSILMIGLAAVLAIPSLVMVAALGLGYVLYYRLQRPSKPSLTVTRTIDDPDPGANDEVEITLSVENIGGRPVYDMRIIDGVPDSLAVTDGAPRRATALLPGQTATLKYTVEAGRGFHEFDPATIIVRDAAGTYEHTYEAIAPSRIHSEPPEDQLPPMVLRQLASGVTGRIVTNDGGPGVEFHAVREYRPGDPLNRIDWNRHARSGELATVDFRKEQMATVVLVIDIRPSARVGPPDADKTASEVCTDTAAALFFGLLDAGDRVGVSTLGEADCWLPPGIGDDHREHGRLLFSSHPSLGSMQPSGTVSVITEEWDLDHRIPDSTQLVFLSPMADGGAARYATRFEARGHPVTVISPDPCGTETPGQLVANIERQQRIRRLRERGTQVIDWDHEETSLATVLERAATRWGQ